MIMLPTITRTVEVVLRLVPDGLREASLAMGASRARTVWSVVLPTARSGVTTGVVLGIARAVGETAPLLFTAFGYDLLNANPFSGPQESLPLFVYRNIQQPDESAIARGFTGALVLLIIVLMLFAIARFIGRDRSRRRTRGAPGSIQPGARSVVRRPARRHAPPGAPIVVRQEDAPHDRHRPQRRRRQHRQCLRGRRHADTDAEDTLAQVVSSPPTEVIDADPLAGRPAVKLYGGPPPGAATLETRDACAWFGDHLVLEGVDLKMPAGEVTALIGPSGCGKSTFLRLLNRMHELVPGAALAGEVLLDGDDIYRPGMRAQQVRMRIGMVFQKPNPFPAMSIRDNVLSGLKLARIKTRRTKADLVEQSLHPGRPVA